MPQAGPSLNVLGLWPHNVDGFAFWRTLPYGTR